jgi:hypothetical protein
MTSITYWAHRKPSFFQQHTAKALLARIKEQRRIHLARTASPSPRLLLCRPRGGLNDSLCQIHRCLIYASVHQRNLIIDTTKAGFFADFSNFFETVAPLANVQTRLDPADIPKLEKLSCRPPSFQNNLTSYELTYVPDFCNYVNAASGERPGIGWGDRDYPEDLLLHDQTGGGNGCLALPYFRFTRSVRDEIKARLAQLPDKYTSLIIRHSDIKLDYRGFLKAVKPQVEGRQVLVSTDSHEALAYARSFLDTSTVHDVANVPDVGGQTLLNTAGVTSRSIIIGCFTQLMGLANATEIYIPEGPEVYPSGFTQLAMTLSGRNDLIRQLLGQ